MGKRWRFEGPEPVWMILAVAAPLAVALVFPHPMSRIVIPWTVVLSIAVLLTVWAGRLPGMVAAVVGALSVWFFNLPPSFSFVPDNGEDAIAVIVITAAGCVVVLLIDVLVRRHRETRTAFVIQGRALAEMQRALLPPEPITIPGVEVGFCYLPGGDEAPEVGGDWLAIVPMSPTRLGIAVGDVSGHGIEAVRTMVDYRFALRTLATEIGSPGLLLERVDRVAATYKTAHFSTALYGIVDATNRRWWYASAGHPPPLVVHEDGSVETLRQAQGPPLGTGLTHGPYQETSTPVREGELIAVYTDGVVERRGEDITDGIRRLSSTIAAVHRDHDGDLMGVSESVLHEILGPSHPDDAALVLIRIDQLTTP